MSNCPWEEILGFRNSTEFNRFTNWLSEQITNKKAEEINEEKLFKEKNIDEKCFLHKESGSKWRLVLTDGPALSRSFRSFDNKSICPWNAILGLLPNEHAPIAFGNHRDFDDFYDWIERQIKLGYAEEVPNRNPMGSKRYKHIASETIWKLFWPDGPAWPIFCHDKACNCDIREPGYFEGEWDFDNFQNYLNYIEEFQEISVEKLSKNTEKEKRRYRCIRCGKIYAFLTPCDPWCECHKVSLQRDHSGKKCFYVYENYVHKSPLFHQIPVRKSVYGAGSQEKWYECIKCKKIYRLLEPDPPFGGIWERIDLADLSA